MRMCVTEGPTAAAMEVEVPAAKRVPDVALGIGWRQELSAFIVGREDLAFVEVMAEAFPSGRPLPVELQVLLERKLAVIPHGVGLSLGGAELPDSRRLADLAGLAERVAAPLVSEHVAFVRAGGLEAGHLLPVPRTRECLEVVVENVRVAQDQLPVPLALEHVAAVFEWPAADMDEGQFLTELLERTDALLLLDVANLHANATNHRFDPVAFLERIPLERVAYVHVAGGTTRDGVYEDTHAHPVPTAVLHLLRQAAMMGAVPAVMLERDQRFPADEELGGELDAIRAAASSATSVVPRRVSVCESTNGY
jgi:uncharacterized protein (UPF0276 family)